MTTQRPTRPPLVIRLTPAQALGLLAAAEGTRPLTAPAKKALIILRTAVENAERDSFDRAWAEFPFEEEADKVSRSQAPLPD